MTEILRPDAEEMDAADPLAGYRDQFVIDDDTLVYLDGNSLGRLPKATQSLVIDVLTHQWGSRLIRSWGERWMDLPTRLGDLVATTMLGANPGEVVVCDTTTVSLYKALSAAIDARPGRRSVVIEEDNFPTDRYVLEGLARRNDLKIRWIKSRGADGLTSADLENVLDDSVAVVTLSHVDYRSSALLDMPGLTSLAHSAGALIVWDLCHSVGAVPIDLEGSAVDLAVGCTYKYLNAGPGAPAFGYVRAALQPELSQPIWGWWSRAEMFDMGPGYQAESGIRAWLTGTPGVLSLAAVEPGVRMLADAGLVAVRAKSVALTELAVRLYDEWLSAAGFSLCSPRDPERRGSHVTIGHPNAQQIVQRLLERGVVPDFRRPDGIRLGFAPLTTRYVDVYDGLQAMREAAADG